MKNILLVCITLLCFACGNKGKTEPADDESRGYYPQENVDESTVKAVTPEENDSTKMETDTVSIDK